jgi:hypothetical protein
VGVDAYGLIAEWEPVVAAFREAGGLDFYWHTAEPDYDDDVLPYAIELYQPGRQVWQAGNYYAYTMRDRLAEADRALADGYCSMIFSSLDSAPDDLSIDAGVPHDGDVEFAMRPATVLDAVARAAVLPWRALEEAGESIGTVSELGREFGFAGFEYAVRTYTSWLTSAAADGHGFVAIISY